MNLSCYTTMALLSDSALKAAVAAGDITIEPFNEANLTPNGYDLTIAQVAIPANELEAWKDAPPMEEKGWRSLSLAIGSGMDYKVIKGTGLVPPQTRFAVSTLERVSGGADHGAMLWLRTSWARKGVISAFGFIDAGFEGTLTLAAFHCSWQPLEVPIGETFAQAVFVKLDSKAEALYAQRSGNYQGQQGVTWEKE